MDIESIRADIEEAEGRQEIEEIAERVLPDTDEISKKITESTEYIHGLAEDGGRNVAKLLQKLQETLQALDNDEDPPNDPDALLNELKEVAGEYEDQYERLSEAEQQLNEEVERLEDGFRQANKLQGRLDGEDEKEKVAKELINDQLNILSNLQQSTNDVFGALTVLKENHEEVIGVLNEQCERAEALFGALRS